MSLFLEVLTLILWATSIFNRVVCPVCPPLPYSSLPHGRIIPATSNSFLFKCDDGFFLGGDSEVRCYKGNWTSEKAPVCYQSGGTCDPPPEIPNADLFGSNENKVDSVVMYMCHPGHVMLGKGMRTCLSSGFWSGITPACISEAEPIQNVADRLNREFVSKMASHSNSSRVQQAYYLDRASLQKGLDLVILVDRSSSVDPFDLNIAKNFIKFLFREFGVKNGDNKLGSRAAVVAFGTTVDILFNLDNASINSAETASHALDELLKPNGGGTAMVPALVTVFLNIEPHLREEAKRALFLISDGEPNIGDANISPGDMANQLKDHANFEIFAVGIGPDINRQTLASVASEPVSDHVFLLKKYTDLNSMLTVMKNKPTEEPPINPEKCGYIDPNKAIQGWPWMAAVYVAHERENSTQLNLCGGALICSRWVLTSASCFFYVHKRSVRLSMSEAFVVLGEDDLLKVDPNQKNLYAADVVIHPDYDPFNQLFDNLALVKLNEPASVELFRPVCLPPTDKTVPLHLDLTINASVAGWGRAPQKSSDEVISTSTTQFHLSVNPVTLAEERECQKSIKRKMRENSIFCAESSGKSWCLGIPGSPVVAQDPQTGINYVLGILSQRHNCYRGYSEYAELRKYIPWINDVTDKCHFHHWN